MLEPGRYYWITLDYDWGYRDTNGAWCVQGTYEVDGEARAVEVWLPADLPEPLPPHKMDEEDTDSPQPMDMLYLCAKYLHTITEGYPGPDCDYDVYTVGDVTPLEHEYGS